ncbi:MAG: methylase [Planctomycetes bacterium]|nr:methylase [Planctomycetota bacterium]
MKLDDLIPMSKLDKKNAAIDFVKLHQNKGYEKGNCQMFWSGLLHRVFGVKYPDEFIQFEKPAKNTTIKFIDAYIPETKVLIEQKSSNVNLEKPVKQSDGTLLSAIDQAHFYSDMLDYSEMPRWIIVCNFQEFYIYDMENKQEPPEILYLKDLPQEYYRLNFLIDADSTQIQKETAVSLKAGEIVAQLYDLLKQEFTSANMPITEHVLTSLNILCVRIVFCLYSDSSELFGRKGMFQDLLKSRNEINLRETLMRLFKVLNQKQNERDPFLEDDFAAFPYINGGLFQDKNITIPKCTHAIYHLLVEEATKNFDWSEISPTVFGSVFENTLNPETRGKGGMHYTSIENIHKVIDPLFLDDLKDEFRNIKKQTILQEKKQALLDLQTKIASLTFLDPACGSGNFLTQTYISLRKLENLILESIHCIDKETNQQTPNLKIKVEIENFHGIEINDFAVTVAKTALWIAELQMMQKTESIMERKIPFFPLKTNAYIHEENALQIDWQNIIPKDKLNYIIGNPPFLGFSLMTKQQKQDQSRLTTHKILDYVACWYYKAAEYIQNTDIQVAFVSTSSITQGEQVGPLWTDMIEKYGLHIDFCYRSFPWDQESEETILYRERQLELATTRKQGAQKQGRQKKEKKQKQERIKKATVTCVIIGFSQTKNDKEKTIFTYTQKPIDDYLDKTKNTKKYETIVIKQIANNINPYLVDAPNIIVQSRTTPICDVPKMVYANKPTDGGHLIIEEKDYDEFIKKEPKAKKFIKKLIGTQEFLYNKDRYALWLVDATPQEIKSMPLVQERIEKVRNFRLKSSKKSTREKALTSSLFAEIRHPTTNYLVIPRVTSDQREYIPMDFVSDTTIATDSLHCIPDCPLYIFAILNSQVHNAWMRVVTGRFGNGYRYSANVVYNNFPFPELTETQKQKLNELGQNILDTRAKYPDSNLAALYDPLTMPPALRKAHQKLDKEVAKIYNKNWDLDNEAEIVSDLMQMYQQLLTTETTDNKNTENTEDDETTETTEDDETTETTETTDNKNIETTENTELETTDKNKNIDKKQSTKTKTRKSKKQTTKNTETTDNKNIETTENTENTELETTDKKESKKTKTTKNKNTKNTETTEKENKELENKQIKAKTRKIKKTDNNETEDKENKQTKVKTRKIKKTDNNEIEDKENKQTKVKTRKTKKTDNNETETEIYASSPMTSKRTIKKVTPKATKATIKSTTNKKVAKSKVTTKSTKETKTTNEKIEKKVVKLKIITSKVTKTTTFQKLRVKKEC